MKKLVTIALTLLLICSLAVPAFAATPSIGIPDVPQISDIKFDIKFEFPDGFWDNWFDDHPISWKLPVPITETESANDFVNVLKNFIG